MKHASDNPIFRSSEPVQEAPERVHAWFISDKETGTVEWILDAKQRDLEPTLDIHDNRELAKTRLKDSIYFAKAKRLYSIGAGIQKIHDECGKSLSYAEKVHAAFERAVNNRNRKNQY